MFVPVPNAGNTLGGTRDQIRTNTNVLRTTIAVNHYDVNDVSTPGKHKFSEFVSQAAIPGGLIAGEYTLYSRTGNIAGAQLFGTRGATGLEVQFTEDMSSQLPLTATRGGTFLPGDGAIGGIIQQWDATATDNNFVPAPIQDNSPFTFPVPFNTACFAVILTGQRTGNSDFSLWVKDGTLSNTGFTIRTNAAVGQITTLYYLAIGY